MKFLGLPFLILCIYLSQISSSMELSDEDINRKVEEIRDRNYGVSQQFMDDLKVILGKFRNNSVVVEGTCENLIRFTRNVGGKENVKIDEKVLRDYHSASSFFSNANALEIAIVMDTLRILQSILSKQLPPERYNGILNLVYIRLNKNATTEEIEGTLGYLYGTETAPPKTSFLDKFPDLNATDCPRELAMYKVPDAENTLKSLVDIKPKVIEDFMAIRDKFPCFQYVLEFLQIFVGLLKRSQGSDSKVDACLVKEKPGQWDEYWSSRGNNRDYMESKLQELESMLSARLTDETYVGIINFLRVTIPDTPIDAIEKALEYLYDDVPKANCPEKEGAKSETE